MERLTLRLLFFAVCFLVLFTLQAGAKTKDEINNIEVFRRASPGVVNITSVTVQYDAFYRPIPREGRGSGAIIDQLGHIVTNNHVIRDSRRLEVTLSDGSRRDALLVGKDPATDLAVIKLRAPGPGLAVIPFGDSKSLNVGQKVMAIGNPFGLGQTLTTGVISSLQRSIRTESGSIIRNVVQTDAAINPGNSGGPLLDSEGQMVGINTMILSPTGASVGVGFAVPADTVRKVVSRLISGRSSIYGILPITFFGFALLFFYLFQRMAKGYKERTKKTQTVHAGKPGGRK